MKRIVLTFLLFLYPFFAAAVVQIDINTASLKELEQLMSVGPAIAQRIIDGRPYASVDDLLKVKGIGEKTLQKIKVQGLAYVSGGMPPPAPALAPPQPQAQAIVPALEPTPASQPPKEYPAGIMITELMPSPEGADEVLEWIELHNSTETAIDLSGWKLQDGQGSSGAYTFPAGVSIPGFGYMVVRRPDTNITLNNDTDTVTLANPDGKMVSVATYNKAITGQSYNHTISGWKWSTSPTPGSANMITAPQASLPKSKKTANNPSVATKEPINELLLGGLEPAANQQNPWVLLLAALGLAVASGAAIIGLKIYSHRKRNLI